MNRFILILSLACMAAAEPPLPPGYYPVAPVQPKPRLTSPREGAAIPSARMVRAVAVPQLLTNVVLAFDPLTNAGTTYRIAYSGDRKGVIDMGTNTSVLVTNWNLLSDYRLEAFSVMGTITGYVHSVLVVPALNRVAAWKSNDQIFVSWYGATNRSYTIQSSGDLKTWIDRQTFAGTNWWAYWSETVSAPRRFYRYQEK